MAQISKNEYGSIVVNDNVLEKQIIHEILEMNGNAIPCNKKGKIIKDNPAPLIDSDYSDAIVVTDTIRENSVKIYLVTTFGESISAITDEIFSKIEQVYDSLHVNKPDIAKLFIMGMKTTSGIIVKRDIEVERRYE